MPTSGPFSPQLCQNVILSRHFRLRVLDVLVRVHMTVDDPEFVSVCHALQFLNRASEVARILDELIRGPEDKALMAYQVRTHPPARPSDGLVDRVCRRLRLSPCCSCVGP
jgi:hypothetical protein